MNVYKCIYKLSIIANGNEHIKEILVLCIASGRYVSKLNSYISCKLGDTAQSYAQELINIYESDPNLGCELVQIIYEFIEDNISKFRYNPNIKWFQKLVDGDIEEIFEGNIYVNEVEYNQQSNELIQYRKTIKQLDEEKKRQANTKESIKALNDKYNTVIKENQNQNEKIKVLNDKIELLKGKLKLKNKKVLCLSEIKLGQDTEVIKERYELRSLKIESSIKSSPKLDDLIDNSDIIIFCSNDAKHNIFDKVKQKDKLYLSTASNLDKIFDEVVIKLGRIEDDKCQKST